MNKPVWIICQNQEWLDKIVNQLGSGDECPPMYDGHDCPKDNAGEDLSCIECWKQYIETEVAEGE